jgi:hypothetical protein
MNCRQFKSNHVGFVDDLLSAVEMSEMRRHLSRCESCAALDTRIRRSLLVVRNLPQIEPSADFFVRLSEALKQPQAMEPRPRPLVAAAAFTAVTAAIAAAVYFAMLIAPRSDSAAQAAAMTTSAAATQSAPVPMSDATIAASAPAGVPVWPAMFMVGDVPAYFANAELLDTSLGR